MVTKLIRRTLGPSIVILIALTCVCLYVWANSVKTQSQPVAYKVLDDPMQTIMKIGVHSEIDEDQLRATLRKAADDHQNDPARDLLLSDYLWVHAYLLDGEKQSAIPAGKLRRYVPPKQPRKSNWFDRLVETFGKKDKFYITQRSKTNVVMTTVSARSVHVRIPRQG